MQEVSVVLILYPATLLNSLRSFRNFLIEFLGFSSMVPCHLQIVTFPFSFPICIPFISFSCLIVMARTSKTMLSKNGEAIPVKIGFSMQQGKITRKHRFISQAVTIG